MTDAAQTRSLSVRTILLVGVGLVVPALPVFIVGALGTQVRSELGLSEAALGLIVATLFVVSALMAPFTGRLADRLGAQFAIATGTVLSFLALTGIGLYAQRWGELMVLMGCAGVGLALVDPGLTRLVAASVPERRRGVVFGIKEASIPLATMAAGFAVPTVAVTVGWRWAVAVGLIPFVSVLVLLAMGGARPRQWDRPDGGITVPAEEHTRTLPPAVLLLAIGAALGSLAATGISVFLTGSAEAAGMTQSQGGLLLGIASVMGIATRVGSGLLADRRPAAAVRLIPWMLAAGSVAMVVGALGTAVLLGIGTLGAFVGGWGWSALFFFALVRANPARPGAVAGVGLSGLAVGNALGPIVFGFVAQTVSYPAAWLLAAASAALAAVSMYKASRRLAH